MKKKTKALIYLEAYKAIAVNVTHRRITMDEIEDLAGLALGFNKPTIKAAREEIRLLKIELQKYKDRVSALEGEKTSTIKYYEQSESELKNEINELKSTAIKYNEGEMIKTWIEARMHQGRATPRWAWDSYEDYKNSRDKA